MYFSRSLPSSLPFLPAYYMYFNLLFAFFLFSISSCLLRWRLAFILLLFFFNIRGRFGMQTYLLDAIIWQLKVDNVFFFFVFCFLFFSYRPSCLRRKMICSSFLLTVWMRKHIQYSLLRLHALISMTDIRLLRFRRSFIVEWVVAQSFLKWFILVISLFCFVFFCLLFCFVFVIWQTFVA